MQLLRGSRCGIKLQFVFLLFLFILLYVAGSLYYIFTQNFLNDASFLETDKCPVCFGTSMCEKIISGEIHIKDASKFSSFNLLNRRSIYYATSTKDNGNRQFIVKGYAGSDAANNLDDVICHEAKMTSHCSVTLAVAQTKVVKDSSELKLFAKHLQGTAPMFVCPSTRLLGRMYARYRERTSVGDITVREKVQLWTAANINAESIFLQTFPPSDGWPFPEYLGSCGRLFVVTDAGVPLSKFYGTSWLQRTNLAYQLMKLVDHLTTNREEFAMYLTDVTYDSFAVGTDGTIRVVNLKDVIVVDKQAIKAAKPGGWEDLHESSFTDCPGQTFKSCHSFSETTLCSHVISDHNYYAICRHVLSRYADGVDGDAGRADGLLHDIPDTVKNDWDLEYLLTECVMPTRKRGRLQVVHKLIEALDVLRQNSTTA